MFVIPEERGPGWALCWTGTAVLCEPMSTDVLAVWVFTRKKAPGKRLLCPKSWPFPPVTAMSQHTLVRWMIQTCPDLLVSGKLPGTALLEELSHGATRVGGTKPAEPALTALRSSPAAFPVAQGWGDCESRWSEECQVSPPALSLLSLAARPSLEKMSQEVVAMD